MAKAIRQEHKGHPPFLHIPVSAVWAMPPHSQGSLRGKKTDLHVKNAATEL